MLRAVLIVQGVLTVWLAFAFFPLGIFAMLANAVLAFTSRGANRRTARSTKRERIPCRSQQPGMAKAPI